MAGRRLHAHLKPDAGTFPHPPPLLIWPKAMAAVLHVGENAPARRGHQNARRGNAVRILEALEARSLRGHEILMNACCDGRRQGRVNPAPLNSRPTAARRR